ncbi:RNA 2'-phosphotransferase [Curtobacterium sp. MCPF17_052]|uniref:RNA 2'-phosphotransferase n=1 Tax=Curtobacterium sp. MCPF17_052 TaxID=2175655 RepID=UPI0024DF6494|nr:RNA 2'-phosphotransferase [Curtobacterium sp. MCPF17_052]WIB13473.1 RNA 2'-phosphotransferase [Curtobacterium sp. MCPF17_052]
MTSPSLLRREAKAAELAALWIDVLAERHEPTLADLILIEYWFSVGAAFLPRHMPARMSYTKTLLTIRQRVAIAIHDYAREVNWRRPVLFVTALKIARAYLRDAVGHEEALRPDLRKNFTGRLGVATVLISRFENVTQEDAKEAIGALERSISQGNTDGSAFAYLLEAHAVYLDLCPDPHLLEHALDVARKRASTDPSFILAQIDLLLRRATHLGFTSPDPGVLREAGNLADACRPTLGEDRVRQAMAKAIIKYLQSGDVEREDLMHARLPFGLRVEGEPNQLLVQSARFLIGPLRQLAKSGEPTARGLLADYLVQATEALEITEIDALKESILLRGGERFLEDERSQLLKRRDQLRLAALTSDNFLRVNTLVELAALIDANHASPAPLVLLARDVEDYGPQPVPIAPGTGAFVRAVLRDISKGNADALYGKAGEAALNSPDLSVLSLGGRSGVTSVADYYGLSSETFVFKNMAKVAVGQERDRADIIARHLRSTAQADRFGVSHLLATYDREGNGEKTVTAARPYIRGRPLYAAVEAADAAQRQVLLGNAASFLGIINRCEEGEALNQGRREVKTKEFGRWLKACGLVDLNDIFDRWWDCVKDADLLRRRDAHLHNWLITEEAKIYAIDLEAQGWRPAGYELAQLSDDHAFLPAGDWQTRRALFEIWRASRNASPAGERVEWLSYQASVLARIVWGLTGTADSPFPSGLAEERLSLYIESVTDKRLSNLGGEILRGWLSTRGLSRLPLSDPAAEGAGRVRTSKSIAFHLRHDELLVRDAGGWVLLEDLQQRLAPRLRVDVLAAVATDKDERRFEIRGGKIRAKYGHSIAAELDYDPPEGRSSSLPCLPMGICAPNYRRWSGYSSDESAICSPQRGY